MAKVPRRSLSELQTSGILWAINRYMFHPRGFSLALARDSPEAEIDGWVLHGDGSEIIGFTGEDDDAGFLAFEGFLFKNSKAGAALIEEILAELTEEGISGSE